ncbi:MAG TPA: MFS transporter [Ktedonobacterales bacterium]|jgi:MFS family permease
MQQHAPLAKGQPEPTVETSASLPLPQPKPGLRRALVAFRHRNYRLYWGGQLISLMGTFMQTIGQSWLVLQLTHSGLQIGLVGALQFLPVLLFSLVGGVFADRWPKRRVLLVTQSVEMLQAFILWALVASNAIQLWQVYLLALLLGLATSLDQPTRSAFVVELVGREDLPNVVALSPYYPPYLLEAPFDLSAYSYYNLLTLVVACMHANIGEG